jgi:mitochondrial import receptor subunit TOM20
VAVLDHDLRESDSHCSHCLRLVHKATAIQPEGDRLGSVYCSKECEQKAKVQYHSLLFSLEPFLPLDMETGSQLASKEERDKVQAALAERLRAEKNNAPLLVVRYLARQVTIETSKVLHPTTSSPTELPPLLNEGSPEYGIADHLERLRFLDAKAPEEDTKLICDVLGAALPGLEQSLLEDRHSTTLGKMMYNAIGISFSGGRDDRVSGYAVVSFLQ